MLSAQVYDVIAATQHALELAQPADAAAARHLSALVQFGAPMRLKSQALKAFLLQHLYRHPQVVQTTGQAKQVVRDLFTAYMSAPQQMPENHQRRARLAPRPFNAMQPDADHVRARAVADYIAGMTDRFAAREHQRITGQHLFTQDIP
jgi:dGTPase